MTPITSPRASLQEFARRKVAPVVLSTEALVKRSYLDGLGNLPLVMTPAADGVDLCSWAALSRATIEDALNVHGAILFRGFGVESADRFQRFITTTSGSPLPYTERSSPRAQVEGNIYTSTEHPPDQEIFLHNEQSYNLQFPLRIYFYCQHPAESAGETPIADCRKVYARLSRQTIDRFADGYMYVRNFTSGIGLSWQEAFQTSDRDRVADYCTRNGIEYEWSGDSLRTRQVRPLIGRHPRTGELAWCNHMTFFNVTTLPGPIQELVRLQCGDRPPNNTYHADGSEIDGSILNELRDAYTAERVVFPWQAGDILMLDNMMVSHARRPFTGRRKVLVGMADLVAWNECQPL